MATRIQLRRDTAANWSSFNPILAQGELGLNLDTLQVKLGDGVTAWNSLGYTNFSLDIDDLDGVTITNPQNGDFLRYNGSASVWINDPVNLSTDTVGDYVQSLVAGTGVTLSNNSGEGSTPTVAIGQAVGTSSSVTFGHVSAPLTGNVVGDLTGNADTATALETARTIEISGDVSGSASFDGTSNINIFTTVNTASVSIGELYGVNITNPLEFQTLEYNGTEWVNANAQSSVYVRNAESTTITTGTAVYLFGATGDHATVKRADNTLDTTSSKTVGLVASNILASDNGVVVSQGYVDGINLSTGYAAGDVLWLGKNGQLTKTKPTAPDHLVFIGVVVRATNNGIVYVSVQNGYELDELHNVKINGLTDGQFLRYNSASTLWVNDTINLGTDTAGNYMAGITAGTGVQVSHTPGEGSDATISIGQDVGTGQSVTFAGATIDAIKIGVTNANTIDTTSGNLTIDSSGGTVTIADNLIVDGTLTVSGSVTVVNTQNLQVGDAIITLNHDETGVPSENAGIEVERGTSANVFLHYNETSDKWELTNNGSTYSPIETTATVDTSLKQQLWLNTVYAATTGVLPNSPSYTAGTTDLNGGTGIGAKLTATTNGTFELDGAPVPLENRILVKNQSNALHNGIYKVTATGSAGATWELTRASDFNNSTFGQTIYGKSVRVATGSVNALQVFAVTSIGSVALNGLEAMIHVIGTDPITWSQVSGKATLIPGNGLQITNNELSLPTISQSNTASTNGATNFIKSIDVDSYGRLLGVTTNNVLLGLGTDTVGDYVQSVSASAGTGITVTGTGEGAVVSVGSNATPNNTNSAIVMRDGSGNFSAGNITAELTGNASTANTLYVSRSIGLTGDLSGSVSFNGSQDVVIAATIQPNSVALGTDTTGDYMSGVSSGTGISVSHTPSEGSTATVSLDATLDNLSNVTVPTPSSGDFLKWNGTAWINDPINLGTDTTGNYMSDLTQGTGVTITHTPGEGSNATIAIGQSVATTASVTFANVAADIVGNVTGNVTGSSGSTTGNAATATTLQNARTISISGDVSGSVSFNGSSDVDITATIQPNSVALGTDTTGNYMSGVSVQNGLTVSHTPAEGSSATIGVDNALLGNYLLEGASGNSYGLIGTSAYLDIKNTNGYNKEIELDIAAVETKLNTDGYITESSSSTLTNKTLTSPVINGNGVVFEGATNNEFETTLSVTDPTADNTITLPNVTGTVVTTGDSGTVTSTMIADGTIVNGDINASAGIALSKLATSTAGNIIVYNASGVPTAVAETGDVTISDAGVTAIASGVIVDADINASAAIDKTKISGTAITAADTGTVTSAMILDGTIVNGDINAAAAIALSKLASGTSGQIIVANASGVPTWVSETGDVTISDTGVTAISSGVIVDADVSSSAAIAHSKLANGTAGQVLLGTTTTGVITATTISGDITINGAGVASIAANAVALGTDTTGDYVASLVAGTGVTLTNNSGEGATPTVAIGQSVATSASPSFGSLSTTGALYVGTDLHVGGTYYTTTETNLAIQDSFIYLNDGNTISNPDLGWAGNYNDGTYAHAGLFRDASDGKFKFFDSYTPEPTDPINTAHASYSAAPVVAERFESTIATGTSPLSVSSSTVVTNLNADLLDGQHGSYYAPLASPTFTGTVTLPTGTVSSGMILDGTIVNADIDASAAIAHSKLANATAGQVLLGTTTTGVVTATTVSGDVTITGAGVTAIGSGVIVDADINASAGIALSKLATSTAGNIIVYNASGVPTAVAETGDITISDTGVTAIASGVIVNADINASAAIDKTKISGTAVTVADTGTVTSTMIADGTIVNADVNASAAIAHSKLANATAGQVLLGTTTTGVVTATTLSGDVTIDGGGVTAIGSGVIVNADVNASAAIAHSKLANATAGQVLLGTTTTGVVTATTVSGDITITGAGVTAIASGAVVDADINASAAITHSKLANITAGSVLMGNATNVPTATALSGDITINSSGVTAIGTGVIVNADVNASAAIDHSKLANITAGSVLLGSATNVPTATALSGDVTVNSSGVTAIGTGVIVNADINASAAIDKTKISGTAVTVADTGTVTSTMIADGTIVNGDISSTAAIDLGKLADVSTNAQTASYTLVLADKNKIVEMNVATANTLTVPLNSSVAFPVGSQINILQTGAGQCTVTATVGVTINGAPGLKLRTQWSYATLVKRATDTWVLVGDISA